MPCLTCWETRRVHVMFWFCIARSAFLANGAKGDAERLPSKRTGTRCSQASRGNSPFEKGSSARPSWHSREAPAMATFLPCQLSLCRGEKKPSPKSLQHQHLHLTSSTSKGQRALRGTSARLELSQWASRAVRELNRSSARARCSGAHTGVCTNQL